MDASQFESLIEREEAKLAEFETAAVAARAAEEGAARAIVTAKLDAKPAAELRRLEADAEAAATALVTAERGAARQREQIAALRAEYADRTHRAEVASLEAAAQQARDGWPAIVAAWDALEAQLRAVWTDAQRLAGTEQTAVRKLQRIEPDLRAVTRIPDVASGKFPIEDSFVQRLHFDYDVWRAQHRAEREEQETRRREFFAAAGIEP